MAQYDDEEMGALDCEEIEGYVPINDSEVLKLAKEFEDAKTEGLKLGRQIGKVVSKSKSYTFFLRRCSRDTIWLPNSALLILP